MNAPILLGGSTAVRMAGLYVLVTVAFLHVSGCGDGRPTRVNVTGIVRFEGEPVEGAHVVFTPKGARPASARTDSEGRFELRTFDPADGAVLGTHRVTISKAGASANPDDPYAARSAALPDRYRRTATSGLTAEVTRDGKNEFVFDLTDEPQ